MKRFVFSCFVLAFSSVSSGAWAASSYEFYCTCRASAESVIDKIKLQGDAGQITYSCDFTDDSSYNHNLMHGGKPSYFLKMLVNSNTQRLSSTIKSIPLEFLSVDNDISVLTEIYNVDSSQAQTETSVWKGEFKSAIVPLKLGLGEATPFSLISGQGANKDFKFATVRIDGVETGRSGGEPLGAWTHYASAVFSKHSDGMYYNEAVCLTEGK